jgi:hypothetical protein
MILPPVSMGRGDEDRHPETADGSRSMTRSYARRIVLRAILVAVGVSASLVSAELLARRIDGYSLTSWRLIRIRAPHVAPDVVTATYVDQIAVASGVDRSWFADDPREASGGYPALDPVLAERASSNRGLELSAVYQWNLEFLRGAACAADPTQPPHQNVVATVFPVGELFVFEPLDRSPFPRYRFLRNARYPSGLKTNEFGWRGPDLALNKPEKTIRIAFVGASTTVGPHASKYSYPDYVRTWLERWKTAAQLPVQFEVINAGREGIDSTSIAAIVRDELAPVDPDVVVYYEGANQFGLADYIVWPGGIIPSRPRHTRPWLLESVSALVVRLRGLRDPFTARRGEPRKPQLPVAWPEDLNEQDPQLDHPRLTLELPTIMRDLDTISGALSAQSGRLVMSSFVWCVKDGMQLDPDNDVGVYGYLNDMFWPFSYAYMRRLADFQNRAFQKYAKTRGLDFIDIAASYPLDPRLFTDGVHMTPGGTKLMAWIAFQRLVPILERPITAGALPRASRSHLSSHPGFAGPPRQLMTVASMRASCPRS